MYLRLDGKSGCIIEFAFTDQFSSLDDYAADLESRHLEFDRDSLHAEFDALRPGSTDTVRLRLEYRPERRFIDGEEHTMRDLDRGFIDSPWVEWDEEDQRKLLRRDGFESILYDVPNATIRRNEQRGR